VTCSSARQGEALPDEPSRILADRAANRFKGPLGSPRRLLARSNRSSPPLAGFPIKALATNF